MVAGERGWEHELREPDTGSGMWLFSSLLQSEENSCIMNVVDKGFVQFVVNTHEHDCELIIMLQVWLFSFVHFGCLCVRCQVYANIGDIYIYIYIYIY